MFREQLPGTAPGPRLGLAGILCVFGLAALSACSDNGAPKDGGTTEAGTWDAGVQDIDAWGSDGGSSRDAGDGGQAGDRGICRTDEDCTDPPEDTCEDPNRLRHYAQVGSCRSGQCDYPFSDINCPYGCHNGACDVVSRRTCSDLGWSCGWGTDSTGGQLWCGECRTPPEPTCVAADTLRLYCPEGTCDASHHCTYRHVDVQCPGGCSGGHCNGCGACLAEGLDTCSDACRTVLGSSGGWCARPGSTDPSACCACTPDPCLSGCTPDCAGRVCGSDGCGGSCGRCDTPPPDQCIDANTLRRYEPAGRCTENGQCEYSHLDVVCPGGCQDGECTGDRPPTRDLLSDTWVATDALGRDLPDSDQVGPPRPDRYVGVFYWIWHGAQNYGPLDNTKILQKNPTNPNWGPVYAKHFWGEPELGYYVSYDPYVIAKHAVELADIGVDAIFFDTTNDPFTWPEHYLLLCKVFRSLRDAGNRTPQIAFVAPFWSPDNVVSDLYDTLYAPGLYQDLWFRWDGKPLILADPDLISRSEIRSFFTFRKPIASYFTGPSGPNQWGWLEVFPQETFYDTGGNTEEVPVGVAQNATDTDLAPMSLGPEIHGRSWHNGAPDSAPDAVLWGFNFAEQWERALAVDPKFVFVTGWNEWTAMRFQEWSGYQGEAIFVDEYTEEYSRDCEPMKDGHGDDYYYQLAAFIRRFKGARPAMAAPETPVWPIAVDGDFSDWSHVAPYYFDEAWDTWHRDADGWNPNWLHYLDGTGRNDIVESRVAYDDQNVYFYVKTRQALTPHTDPYWMLLFLNTDADPATGGFRGYEYVVGDPVLDEHRTTVQRLSDGRIVAVARYADAGNELELALPIGLFGGGPNLTFRFHWADNPKPRAGGRFDLDTSGDSAPNRRFDYLFTNRPSGDCSACLPQGTDCPTACHGVMGGTGYCAWPGSTDPGRCCYCYETP